MSRLLEVARRERYWLAAFVALLTFCRLPNIDGWDEAFYVGQLLSLGADGDLRLQDELVRIPRRFEEKHRILTTTDSRGALLNTFGIGPALLVPPLAWPLLAASTSGAWLGFRAAAALAAMTALGLTALVSCRLFRRFGVVGEAVPIATGLSILGGPLFLYGTRFYLNAHLTAALLVGLMLLLADSWLEEPGLSVSLGLGLAAGMASVNRWQDVVIVAPIAVVLVLAARGSRSRAIGLLLAAGAFLLVACAQMLAWWVQFGTPLLVPQGGGYLRWLRPQIVPLLLSSFHGLVPWAPGLALGLLGLVFGLREATPPRRGLLLALLAGSVLSVYLSAAAEDWWGRDGYGPRRLVSLTPIAALGLGFLLRRRSARSRVLLSALVGLWAVAIASAHVSGFDDLSFLIRGRLDPFNPFAVDHYAGARWLSSWGPLHLLKPGFSFSDAPRLGDRLLGILAVAAVVATGRVVWPLLSRSRSLQVAVVLLALAQVLAWDVRLWQAPSNLPWNARWQQFLSAPAEDVPLPPEMASARDVVLAVHAFTAGDSGEMRRTLERLRTSGLAVSEADVARAAGRR